MSVNITYQIFYKFLFILPLSLSFSSRMILKFEK